MTVRSKSQNTVTPLHAENGQSLSHTNGIREENGRGNSPSQYDGYWVDRSELPTFPEESGWRDVTDPETGVVHRVPLTLLDILYLNEDDMGVVHMAQSIFHDIWLTILKAIFTGYKDPTKWLITSDVFIYWHIGRAKPAAPDLAAFRGGRLPPQKQKSYHVGKDGPVPVFVLEITSQDTRENDLKGKVVDYAAVGVQEYLVVDIETPANEDWRLLGYRLEDSSPYYQPIEPDEDGGLTFETIGYRFTCTGRSEIQVYDAATGKRLLNQREQRERAENAEKRAKNAEERAESIEKENAELRAELDRYRTQQGTNPKNP
ncbi:MAG: Uma2 family endonuclease [Chloroflexota bacterium]